MLGLTLTEPLFPLKGLGIAAVLGWFQGTIGALTWSIPISLWLLYKWFVVDKFLPWNGKTPFLAIAVIGTSAGLFGGILVDLGLIFAQRKETLLGAGWILKLDDSRWTAFTVTGVAYAELALGGMIGCTCALTIMSIVRQLKWKAWLSSIPGKIENLEGMLEAISGVLIEATRWGALIILVPMLATGSICYLFLQGQSPHILRYLGEAISLGLSGIVFVAGMLLGLLTLTKGFEITGEAKCSLSPMAESSNQSQAAAKA